MLTESREAKSPRGYGWPVALKTTILILATVTISLPSFHGNLGVVDAGKVFRSAQPLEGFERLVHERKLASVLDLRAGSNADWWYENEVRVCSQSGVEFYDFPMSAERRPTRRALLVLIDLFKQCRYPLLIHCKSGSDRTGLASALYQMIAQGVPPEKAEEAFSLRYWHVPIFGHERLHDPIVEYAAWLAEHHQTHTPARFRSWVEQDYASGDEDAPIRPLRPGPREQIVIKPSTVTR
jgi:Tyrosine phosphatase family